MKNNSRSAFQVLSRKLLKLRARLRSWSRSGTWKSASRAPVRRLNPIERRRIAYYELGHALVASALGSELNSSAKLSRTAGPVCIEPREPRPEFAVDDSFITRSELEVHLAVLLGGRAAEEVAFGQASTGAAADLQRATEIANRMVTVYGMESCLGPVTFAFLPTEYRSEQTQREIDECIREILSDALNRAIRVLRINRKVLDDAAKQLVERTRMNETELAEYFRRMRPTDALVDGLLSGR